MAAPTLVQYTGEGFVFTDYASSTTHNVAMPATVAAGDLLGIIFGCRDDGNPATPSGWTRKPDSISDTGENDVVCFLKDAVGDEDGTNVNITTANAQVATAYRFHVLAAEWNGDIANVFAGFATGADNNPNPPLVNPAVSADYLALVYMLYNNDGLTITYPTNYTADQLTHENGTSPLFATFAAASRALSAASSEDPGTFGGGSASQAWIALTILIAPAAGGGGTAVKDLIGTGFIPFAR